MPEATSEDAFLGEYLEVEPPARLASTFEFTGIPGVTSDGRLDAG